MYTLLEIISKKIKEELEIDCFVMPYAVRDNSPQLVFIPKSYLSYEDSDDHQGRGADYIRTTNELHIDLVLMARGKSRDFVENFYAANKKITKKFRRPYTFKLAFDGAFNVKVDLRKVENGGEYWTNKEGDETDDLFTLSEIWQGVIQMKENE